MAKAATLTKTRVIVHLNFKNGMEEKGLKLIEREIFDLLIDHGATGIELFQSADNPSHYFYAADWNTIEDAKRAQKEWEGKIKELQGCCTAAPKREFYNMKAHR